eukprot:scpid28754/ scgid5150/ Probable G-protein coupled receptor 112
MLFYWISTALLILPFGYGCEEQSPKEVEVPEGCQRWLWEHRLCFTLANETCATLNGTCLAATGTNVYSNCSQHYRMSLIRASCIHQCGQPILNPNCAQSESTFNYCLANLTLANTPVMYKRGDCRFRERPSSVPLRCLSNMTSSFLSIVDSVPPIQDIENISSQADMISRAASILHNSRLMNQAELDCALTHLRNSVERTFGNRCRWQGRTVVGEDEERKVKDLSNSYVSVLGSIVTQLGCVTEQRSWCSEDVDYDSVQKNSNRSVAGRQQLAFVLDSGQEILDGIPPLEDSVMVVSTPQFAMSVVCPSNSAHVFSIDVLADGDEGDIEMSVDVGQTERQSSTTLLSIHMPVIAGRENSWKYADAEAGECPVLPMQFMVFRYADVFMGISIQTDEYEVVTPVVSAAFTDTDSNALNLTATPVKIVFNIEGLRVNIRTLVCAYWEDTTTVGEWLTNGCRISVVDDTRVCCECSHLSSFALLKPSQFSSFPPAWGKGNPEGPPESETKLVALLIKILCPLSILGLLITVGVILSFRKLRTMKLQRLIVQISVPAIATTTLLMFFHESGDKVGCKTIAMLTHFSRLVLFAMLALACSELYYGVICVFDLKRKKSKLLQYAWIFGVAVPALTVILAAAITHGDAYGSRNVCWINKDIETRRDALYYGTFVAPLALMLIHNFVICCKVISRVAKQVKRNIHGSKLHRYKRMVVAITTLSVLTGLSWIGSIFIRLSNYNFLIRIFNALLSSLQGVAIFIIFILRSAAVRKSWAIWWRKRRSANPSSLVFSGPRRSTNP